MKPIIIIPSRLGSSRFPNKPLSVMGKHSLLGHVITRAKDTFTGDIVVACCEEEVKFEAKRYGVEAVMTDPSLASGSDRIYQALELLKSDHELVVNLQGDMAVFPDDLIQNTLNCFTTIANIDVATAVCDLEVEHINDASAVKVALEWCHQQEAQYGKALYFSRTPIPYGATQFYKHIGLYVYRKAALQAFVSQPPSHLEVTEQLEQLRGLSMGQSYGVVHVDGVFMSVDTPQDAQQVERYYNQMKGCSSILVSKRNLHSGQHILNG